MPLTYGFRQYPPRAQTYLNPWTGATVAYPVIDLSTQQNGAGVCPDRSPYGNNGVVVNGPMGVRGVFDEGQKLDGVDSYINCGDRVSLNIGGDISVSSWVLIQNFSALYGIVSKNNAFTEGWRLVSSNATGTVSAAFYDGGGSSVTSVNSITANRPAHVGFTVKSNLCRVFLDGLEEAHGTVAMTDSFWNDVYAGAVTGPASYLPGYIELVQEWNGAISPELMYRNYLQASSAPVLYDTLESCAVTPVAKAAGSMCGLFRVTGNTAGITIDSNGTHWIYGASAGVYLTALAQLPQPFAYGTFDFSFYRVSGATDTFIVWGDNAAAGINGYGLGFTSGGNIVLYRYTGGGVAAVPLTTALVLADNTQYFVRTVRRPGGAWSFYLKGGAYTDWTFIAPASDNTYTTTNTFLLLYGYYQTMFTGFRQLYNCERPDVAPWEFSSGSYGGTYTGGRSWLVCVTAGVTYVPKDLDWTRCEFGFYKGGGATVIDALFVASEIGTTATVGQYGYALRVSSDERLQLIRIDNGVETLIAETAIGYVALTTAYRIKITHNGTTNAYAFFIQGGAYTDWTDTGLSATLGIYTTGNYVCFDIDASDRLTAPEFSK